MRNDDHKYSGPRKAKQLRSLLLRNLTSSSPEFCYLCDTTLSSSLRAIRCTRRRINRLHLSAHAICTERAQIKQRI